jgi:hypothetical protein
VAAGLPVRLKVAFAVATHEHGRRGPPSLRAVSRSRSCFRSLLR